MGAIQTRDGVADATVEPYDLQKRRPFSGSTWGRRVPSSLLTAFAQEKNIKNEPVFGETRVAGGS